MSNLEPTKGFVRRQFDAVEINALYERADQAVQENATRGQGWASTSDHRWLEEVGSVLIGQTITALLDMQPPEGGYQIRAMLQSMREYGHARFRGVDAQITMLVWVISRSVSGTHRAKQDGLADALLGAMNFSPEFKLTMRKHLFDNDGLHVPFLTIYSQE